MQMVRVYEFMLVYFLGWARDLSMPMKCWKEGSSVVWSSKSRMSQELPILAYVLFHPSTTNVAQIDTINE